MREKCDHLEEKVRKLKKAVKIYHSRLKEAGASTDGRCINQIETLMTLIGYCLIANQS